MLKNGTDYWLQFTFFQRMFIELNVWFQLVFWFFISYLSIDDFYSILLFLVVWTDLCAIHYILHKKSKYEPLTKAENYVLRLHMVLSSCLFFLFSTMGFFTASPSLFSIFLGFLCLAGSIFTVVFITKLFFFQEKSISLR